MDRVVITGMGVVSPIGADVASFEESLFAGRHGITGIESFDASDVTVSVAARVANIDVASCVPLREARRLDAYSLYGLIAAKQALAQSDVVGAVDPYRLSVFMSTGLGGLGTVITEADGMRERGPRRVSPLLIPRVAGNMLAGQVAIEAGARGPAMAHLAACASSAVSIGEGMRAIRHGYADAVVCGGADSALHKLTMAGFENLRALSPAKDPDRASIPFDRERGGFVMGEGGAALVLERESHARARGANILAAVSGYGFTSDAFHITAPDEDGDAVRRAISDAVADAGEPERGVFVNAHGTGTMLNDQVEADAIARVVGPGTLVSSTKSMTGHMLGAAGAAEAIAVVLSLRRGAVPTTVGTREVDEATAVDVVRGTARTTTLTRGLSLSLGFGGHNACLAFDLAA